MTSTSNMKLFRHERIGVRLGLVLASIVAVSVSGLLDNAGMAYAQQPHQGIVKSGNRIAGSIGKSRGSVATKVVMNAPGTITVLPVEITAPGNYDLSADLYFSQTGAVAVAIRSAGVNLDCGWHSIRTSTDTGATGVFINPGLADVSVSNCILDGFQAGIRGNAGGERLALTGNEIRNGTQFGIYVGGDNSRIALNRVVDLQVLGPDPSIFGMGIFVASFDSQTVRPARGVILQDNQIASVASESGDVAALVLRGNEGTQLLGNKILDLRPGAGRKGYGIWLTESPNTSVPTTGTVIRANAILTRRPPDRLAAYAVDADSSQAVVCEDNVTVGLAVPAFEACESSRRNVGSGYPCPVRVNGSHPQTRTASGTPMPVGSVGVRAGVVRSNIRSGKPVRTPGPVARKKK